MNCLASAPAVEARGITGELRKTADMTRPAARKLHVEPTATGRWAVCHEHGARALSDHPTANEAKFFAKRRARSEGIPGILVHDAYQRVQELPNFHSNSG
jgi:hypothetical protein